MKYYDSVVQSIQAESEGIFRLRVKPIRSETFTFFPGQYVFMKNPRFHPQEGHAFSIASSPLTKGCLEFCIKEYGNWTQKIANVQTGDSLKISKPTGTFIWNDSFKHAVFLIGGLGISPVMSILRTIHIQKADPYITLLYGSRSPSQVVFKKELENLACTLSHFKIIHIFSHLHNNHTWQGYSGFITEEIVKKEIDRTKNPHYFIVGPPIFLEKMIHILEKLSVSSDRIHRENVS